jgi:hypothetical protein
MDDKKPSTKHLVLKPREIIPTDKLARPGDGTAISVELMHQQNAIGELKSAERMRTGAPFPGFSAEPEPALAPVFKPKEVAPMDLPAQPGDEEAIRVHGILAENQVAEEQSGWGRIRSWSKRKSKRDKDFMLAVGGVDLAILAVMGVMRDQITMVFGLSAITLFTSVTAWIMFVVMDDY